MIRQRWGFIVVAVLLTAAGGGEARALKTEGRPTTEPSTTACEEPGRCEPPADIVAAAQEEGQVVMQSTIGSDTMAALAEGMMEKYGIEVVYTEMQAAAALERVQSEFDADNIQTDFIIRGGEPVLYTQWLEDGLLRTFTEEEVPNSAALGEERLLEDAYFMWGGTLYALGWNNDALPDGEKPESYCDFADPKWRGNFGLTFQPGSTTFVHYDMIRDICGPDILKDFVENDVQIFPATPVANEALAAGEIGGMIVALPDQLEPLIAQGAPLEWTLPEEGVTLPTRWAALINDAPHPNAALVFANYLLSVEGQNAAFSGGRGVSILPDDLVTDDLNPPGLVVPADIEDANAVFPEIAADLGQD